MYNKLLLFISIIIIIFILIRTIHNKYYINRYDTFATPKSPKEINDNDGHMNFNFLKDEHTNYVINKYYLDDDKKINGKRVNIHPYQEQVLNNPVPIDRYSQYLQGTAFPYIYGNPRLHKQRTPGQWNKYDTVSQEIYNKYGIRR
jgi:hypothetical protein